MFGRSRLRNEETIKINVQDKQMARWKCSDHRRISCYLQNVQNTCDKISDKVNTTANVLN